MILLLSKVKALTNKQEGARRKISCAKFNAFIYRNIGTNCHPIISALNLRPKPVSFPKLYNQLITHEILLKAIKNHH